MTRISRRSLFGGTVAIGLLAAGPALALTLDEARSSGLVGEKPDGYVGIVRDAAGVAALVADVNARRRSHYQEIAMKEDIPVSTVEALAGVNLIERTPAGQYVMDSNGAWVRK